ncbi:FKBP-type peptidyl-prolyl cis-trans isomerase [Aeromicrobium sp. YIM 150415]|uniref:FKBP-type peptidyl-prolyl cis-trans isomerase n=1 Tax=Aeromicrobium sp. YIM 150415 TaxID=2803912 RepID=UPI0019664352|nr:FKBP-type peptidyl-prolyl cis-trans isomerase [Aeromicrobium sp. YIM 150415]MBM9462508.1 FKBP-type peptidyl-prolyl cis-trans isomerase [Aeromicrobium sp. YIM 150415]
MRKSLGVLTTLIALLAVSACGGGSGSSLDDVEVSGDDTPSLEVPEDFSVAETTSEVVDEGDGEDIAEGDTVKVNYIAVNGRTGSEFDNSFANERPMVLTLNETALPGFTKGLEDQKVGSRVLIAVTGEDGASLLQDPTNIGLEETDTMVFLFDVLSKVPESAEGAEQELAPQSPTVEYDDDDHPSGVAQGEGPQAFDGKAVSEVLIEGEGDEVASGQTVVVHYVGSKYPSGEVFDGSWERGAPSTFPIGQGQVIPCWDETLVGAKVGSRLLLECPVDTAYGEDAAAQGRPDGDLAFVVDVLDAF